MMGVALTVTHPAVVKLTIADDVREGAGGPKGVAQGVIEQFTCPSVIRSCSREGENDGDELYGEGC